MRVPCSDIFGRVSIAATLLLAAGSALAQPANNNCASAQVVVVAANSSTSVAGTTVGATVDGTATCGSSSTTPDVWYRVTAPASGQLTAQTCTAASYDTVVSIRTACAGSQLGCDDDACGVANRSTVAVGVTAGTDYWIRVSGFSGATGTFTLTVTHAPPPQPPNPTVGPDVTVSTVTDVIRHGTNSTGTITAYSVGT